MREFYKPYGFTSYILGGTGAQMGGWFSKEINTVEDLKGLKVHKGHRGRRGRKDSSQKFLQIALIILGIMTHLIVMVHGKPFQKRMHFQEIWEMTMPCQQEAQLQQVLISIYKMPFGLLQMVQMDFTYKILLPIHCLQ
jgi:hypothetical protein